MNLRGEVSMISMQINSEVDKIVNKVTQQNRIRFNEITRYPLCILYKEFSENIEQMLEAELITKFGNEKAVILSKEPGGTMSNSLHQAVLYFQEKMEDGSLQRLNQYYIPIIFMADSLDASQMIADMRALHNTLKQEGLNDKCQICFYCIFDYAKMDGKKCREQLTLLQENKSGQYPIGIFSQDNTYKSEYSKYKKAIQSMVMHIFLQSMDLRARISMTWNYGRGIDSNFVVGYWKLDILKQKIIDYLIDCIMQQHKRITEIGEYRGRIHQVIDGMMDYTSDELLMVFSKMPVYYNQLNEYLQPGIFRTARDITYRELMLSMYGSENPCYEFLKTNISDSTSEDYINYFFASAQLGNLYAVKNDLYSVLQEIQKDYEKEIKVYQSERISDSAYYRIGHRTNWADIINTLKNNFWKIDAEIFRLERKIQFIDALIIRMNSPDFQKHIRENEERNRDEINGLVSIRAEAVMPANPTLNAVNFQPSIQVNKSIFRWDMDVLNCGMFDAMQESIIDLKDQVDRWLQKNIVTVLGDFVQRLDNMKTNHLIESYYSARLYVSRNVREAEALFVALDRIGNGNDIQRIENIIRLSLPEVDIIQCDWENNMCFELFAFRKVKDFSDIYNMN